MKQADEREKESRLILARAAREGDLAAGTRMPGAEMAEDRIEALAARTGRVLALAVTIGLFIWLAIALFAFRP